MSRIRRLPKEYRPLISAAVRQGATAINRKDGVLLRLPDGGTLMFHSSPGRAARHSRRRELEKHGIKI